METQEANSVHEMSSSPDPICIIEDSRINSTGRTFPNLQSITETLLEQEELERCIDSEGYQDVHESGQELAFCHEDQEGSQFLHAENQLLREARTCKVCRVAEVSVVILPCGHLVSCFECTPTLPHCPACRQKIRGTVRTFLN